MNKYYCGTCKKDVEVKTSETFYSTKLASNLKHFGVNCKICGRWIKWISHKEAEWNNAVKKLQ